MVKVNALTHVKYLFYCVLVFFSSVFCVLIIHLMAVSLCAAS